MERLGKDELHWPRRRLTGRSLIVRLQTRPTKTSRAVQKRKKKRRKKCLRRPIVQGWAPSAIRLPTQIASMWARKATRIGRQRWSSAGWKDVFLITAGLRYSSFMVRGSSTVHGERVGPQSRTSSHCWRGIRNRPCCVDERMSVAALRR